MRWFLHLLVVLSFAVPSAAQAQYYIKRDKSEDKATAPKTYMPYYPKKQSLAPKVRPKTYAKKPSAPPAYSSQDGGYKRQCSASLKSYVDKSYAAFMAYLNEVNNPANAAAQKGKPQFGDYGQKDKDTLKYIAKMRSICTMETALYGAPRY